MLVRLSVLPLALVFCLVAASSSATPVPNVIPTSAPVWTGDNPPPATTSRDDYGYGIAPAGDVNGDGFGDVLVGAPGWNLYRGRALLYLGSASGLSNVPAWILEGSEEGGALGTSVAGAGDVNRDGYADIIVGEPGAQGGRGRARLFLGSRRGFRPSPFWEQSGDTDEQLGSTVAFAGDVDSDGYDDVLVGCSSMNSSVRLYLGRPGHLDRDPAWVLPGTYACDGVGDVNGDGFGDVAVQPNGTTAVFHGSRLGLSNTASWTGPWAVGFSGRGDVNGDGFDDLLLGPVSIGVGDVHLYLGTAAGLGPTPAWNAADGSSNFGLFVSIAGDVNADGISDIAVSAPRHREDLASAPSVFVYLGTHGLPSTTPSWRGTSGFPTFLRPVALGADVDGDGSSEVLFADPASGGRVFLYALGPAYPAPFITHEPAAAVIPAGTALTLEADIFDDTHSVERGEIVYRFVEDFESQPPIIMEHVTGDLYRGTIPAPAGYQSGLVYSIHGVDDHGLVGATELVGVDYVFEAASRFRPRVVSAVGAGDVHIRFTTRQPGPARIRIFDVSGRLFATVLNTPELRSGEHRVEVREATLPRSGVFFYRIETSGGAATGRLVRVR